MSTGDMSYPDLSMFDFLIIVMEKLNNTTKDEFKLDEDNSRLPFKKDLQESVREALVNSLMHAYYGADFPIKITSNQDYYEFINPGKMRVSISEFIHGGTSKIRNSTIATFLRRAGIAEKAGSGGPKIFDTASKYKLKLPEVHRDNDKTTVIIWKVDLLHNVEELPEIEQKIMRYIIDKGSVTRKELMESLKLKDHESRNILNSLIENEFILRVGKGKATKYVLHTSSPEHIHSMKRLLRNLEESMKY